MIQREIVSACSDEPLQGATSTRTSPYSRSLLSQGHRRRPQALTAARLRVAGAKTDDL
jgi:hypothetical protein